MNNATTLAQWLDYIQQLHPSEIDMGLDRVKRVASRLGFDGWPGGKPAPVVITVTGTNGKGSHVATLDTVLRALGYRTGSYTSPHLLRYNERVQLHGTPVDDQALTDAFAAIEQARGETSLSYFEFGTLAALMIFAQADLDVVVLEVGLGGRLDAVNIIDADVAIVSSIGLDHQEWLGDTRESVAQEKAGIFRMGKPVICTDPQPPANLLQIAVELHCPLYLAGRDFAARVADGDSGTWQLQLTTVLSAASRAHLLLDNLPLPALKITNVAGALQAAMVAGLLQDQQQLRRVLPDVLTSLQLAGRQQLVQDGAQTVMLDVSHNPQAAELLSARLATWRAAATDPSVCVHLVLAMMHDKDHAGYILPLEKQVDFWYIAHFDLPRCMPSAQLARRLTDVTAGGARISVFDDVAQAYQQARQLAGQGDLIVVSGSFFTVAAVLSDMHKRQMTEQEARPL